LQEKKRKLQTVPGGCGPGYFVIDSWTNGIADAGREQGLLTYPPVFKIHCGK
jgi:hypothetical protein